MYHGLKNTKRFSRVELTVQERVLKKTSVGPVILKGRLQINSIIVTWKLV